MPGAQFASDREVQVRAVNRPIYTLPPLPLWPRNYPFPMHFLACTCLHLQMSRGRRKLFLCSDLQGFLAGRFFCLIRTRSQVPNLGVATST